MSKNWYPAIDYDKYTSCLECVKFCPHNVLIEENAKPLVKNLIYA